MRSLFPRARWAAVAAAAIALTFGITVPEPAAADPPPLSRLSVRGSSFVDEHGRVVLLRGVNNVDKDPPYVTPGDGLTITARDAELLARHGFNAVRLGVEFAGLMPERGRLDRDYIERLARTVDALGRAGIYVLLDNHQDSMSAVFRGNGFPAWAVDPKPFPGEPNPGWPLNSATMASLNLAWSNFWTNRHGVVDRLGDALSALAARLRGNPAVLGYEVMNEPWPGVVYPSCIPSGCPKFDAQYQGVHEKLTRRIREGDPAAPVLWEPHVMWNQTIPTHIAEPPLTPAITDPSIVFSFHDYCAFNEAAIYLGLPRELVGLCGAQHDRTWSNYETFAKRAKIPALVTEFGGDSRADTVARTLDRADQRLLGWMWWHYSSIDGPTVRPDPFTGELGRQLVRTYPRATSGIPLSLTFDAATGETHFRYRPEKRGAPTEISTSDLHYPQGYTVEVRGGRVTSAANSRVITVEAADDAQAVEVTVKARS
ncbi:cellulase family glycosylhydrolase [Nocardia sp. CDC159]|uniref:Cellulase family glycosylhydrolase n=1 Tax=Nocardia pulmonis TaxID=2951408 RepID=A0A9X2IW51_9NOCA|nr:MULTISPECIES: cellulase family glycosylhydrolase [Nocardia]MCM6773903.1 cellulase family glycosylhydrolase [Nocardia pulmonis]MCM6786790.1 cellulase family glycosylhydrolase [Nocardia sp. CDC159]